jgi:glycerophosphoryl diester phosphodiesterase
MKRLARTVFRAALALCAGCSLDSAEQADLPAESMTALLIAHRGASGYAPEHTMAAYRLALEQGADFIEPDLQITRDGILIALHDLTLERTTNVAEVFPDRYREELFRGETVRRWYANDFTLEELRRLDAGSWFDGAFEGVRIPTLSEVIELARGQAGIFPETKAPEVYGDRGYDMERLLMAELERHGLHEADADPLTPVVIQSFSAESLRILRHEVGTDLPLTFLISGPDSETWLSEDGLAQIGEFATGIGPTKSLLLEHPDAVDLAHQAGLTVIPWTFRAGASGEFATVEEEMAHFLFGLGVDGLFTNNPDLFPRTAPEEGS